MKSQDIRKEQGIKSGVLSAEDNGRAITCILIKTDTFIKIRIDAQPTHSFAGGTHGISNRAHGGCSNKLINVISNNNCYYITLND